MKRPMRLLPIVALLVAGCASLPPSTQRYEIVGYYPGWKGKLEVDARQLTVLNYAFLDICWDGLHGNPAEATLVPCRVTSDMVTRINFSRPEASGKVLFFSRVTSPKNTRW